jgi:hypothetical protein
MRISKSSKFSYKSFNGQVYTAVQNPTANQNSTQQNQAVKKSNPLKRIPTSTYIYSATAIGLLAGGIILHHQLKNNPKQLEKIVKEGENDLSPKNILKEESEEIQNHEILEQKPQENIKDIPNPIELDSIDKTFKKLEEKSNELKEIFNSDKSARTELFNDFDTAFECEDKNVENKVFNYLTNRDNSREAQNLIYNHLEKDYEPAFDSLVDRLYTADVGGTYIPALRVMVKRGNENDIKEIQNIMQTPRVSSMIYTNIAVSYKKLPKERFDKDIIPIFDGLYADKKVAFLQVFETHKSREYAPLLDNMSRIQGYESFIYPQIEHAKNACLGLG